jgi:hypothetical protein
MLFLAFTPMVLNPMSSSALPASETDRYVLMLFRLNDEFHHACRCGKCSLLQVLVPFRLKAEDPRTSLPDCVSMLTGSCADGIKLVLSELSNLTPRALLDLPLSMTSSGAGTPALWSVRWCLLAGSFCDVLLGHNTESAVFWPTLVKAVSSPDCAGQLDIWGGQRKLDLSTLHALRYDASGVLWGRWLVCGMLSGMLPEELSICPELAAEVLMRRCSASVPRAAACFTLDAAAAVVENESVGMLQSALRVAVVSVIAITVASAASSMVRFAFRKLFVRALCV